MAVTLRVALDPLLEDSLPEVTYALRTLLRIAGYGYEFVWSTRPEEEEADIYYGSPERQVRASCRIDWCGRSFLGKDDPPEPVALRRDGALDFLDFGEQRSTLVGDSDGRVHFLNDIVFSSFWLLSGVAERQYIRDDVDNFELGGAFFLTNKLLEKPLVSDYGHYLRGHFSAQGHVPADPPWNGKAAAFAFTHDVDYPEMIRWIEAVRVLVGRAHAPRRTIPGILSGANHFWKFSDWIEMERQFGARSAFNFSARRGSLFEYATGTPDCFYDIRSSRFGNLFRYLRDEGCEIGLHASFHSFRSADRLQGEKHALELMAGVTVHGGRHHYWRLDPEAPEDTIAIHEQIGMRYDSSLAFEFYPGFRRGICHPYRPFQPSQRRELNILEIPPAWMDDHFDRRLAKNGIAEGADQEPEIRQRTMAHANRLLDSVRRSGGTAVVDYHARGMNADFYPRYGPWLRDFARMHLDSSFHFGTPAELAEKYEEYLAVLDRASVDNSRSDILRLVAPAK